MIDKITLFYKLVHYTVSYVEFYFVFQQDLGGNLGAAKDREFFFQKLIIESDNYYNKPVWVYMPLSPGLCSVFLDDFISIENDCQNLLFPFVCEKGKLFHYLR